MLTSQKKTHNSMIRKSSATKLMSWISKLIPNLIKSANLLSSGTAMKTTKITILRLRNSATESRFTKWNKTLTTECKLTMTEIPIVTPKITPSFLRGTLFIIYTRRNDT